MRKIIILFIALATTISCSKNASEGMNENIHTLIPLNSDTKQSSAYTISTKCGHTASDCSNSCVTAGGYTGHVNCQGDGSACDVKADVALSLSYGDYYSATTLYSYDLTSEDFFLMPDRSLFVELVNGGKEELWLNIPEQLAVRDSVTELFTFYDLFFTSYPVYKNQ